MGTYIVFPMKSAEVGVADALHDLVSSMVRRRPRDLSLTAASLLSRIEQAGARRLGELAIAEGVAQPSMSTIVGHLERLGLVARKPDPSDGRAVIVELTPAGRKYVRQRRANSAATYRSLIDQLSNEESQSLQAALPALCRLVELATAPSNLVGAGGGAR